LEGFVFLFGFSEDQKYFLSLSLAHMGIILAVTRNCVNHMAKCAFGSQEAFKIITLMICFSNISSAE